jgi:hypothetical protein
MNARAGEIGFTPPTSVATIERLLKDRIPESLHLEYKAGAALFSGKEALIVTKSVSAMAHADGGVVLFGVVADDEGVPVGLSPVLKSECSKERLEDLINLVSPRVAGADLQMIDVDAEHAFYAVSVPASRGTVHQASDFRYYRRHQTKCHPMDDSELADVRRRNAATGARVTVELHSRGYLFDIVVANTGDAAAEQVVVTFEPSVAWRGEIPLAFARPMRILPVGRSLAFLYGSAPEILGPAATRPARLVATAVYRDASTTSQCEERFDLDIEDYRGSQALKTDIESLRDQLKEAIGKVDNRLGALERSTAHLAPIVDPTGLSLSITTLRNLAHLLGRELNHEKIAVDVDAEVFREVLGIGEAASYELEGYFRFEANREGQTKRLEDLKCWTPELGNALQQHFLLPAACPADVALDGANERSNG